MLFYYLKPNVKRYYSLKIEHWVSVQELTYSIPGPSYVCMALFREYSDYVNAPFRLSSASTREVKNIISNVKLER